MQVNYDRRHKATKEADEPSPGDRAWLPDLRVEGKVVGRAPGPRSYIISTPTRLVRRNRKMTRNPGPGHKGRRQNSLAAASIFSSQLQPTYVGKAIHNC